MMAVDKKQLLTIPNLLSLVRLLMIPGFVMLYRCGYEEWTAAILIISGITDIVDGYIARHFNQVSDLGKILDPIADKLTQAVMLICLIVQYPVMAVPLLLLIVKEVVAGISGLIFIRKTGIVPCAEWHGKLTTALLYGMMIIHVLWQDIPVWTSNLLNVSCVAMMLTSLVLYGLRNISAIRSSEHRGE